MSDNPLEGETVAERILAVRRSLKPPEGRRSRLGYPSRSDFAAMVGVGLNAVNLWETGQGYPDPTNRTRLAELSGGRYEPDDFKRPGEAEYLTLEARVRRAEAEIRELREELHRRANGS